MDIKEYDVILASGSPRRIQMLQDSGVTPRIIKPQCKEILHMPLEPQQIVMSLALKKGQWVEERLAEEKQAEERPAEGLLPDAAGGASSLADTGRPALLIASDTIVYCDGVMGKPKDENDAMDMLRRLKNRSHSVFTGVYLYFPHLNKKTLFFDETKVFVNDVDDDWLRAYVASGEPMDKAGAYAIQGGFGVNIDHIEGNYSNVVGFPIERILAAI